MEKGEKRVEIILESSDEVKKLLSGKEKIRELLEQKSPVFGNEYKQRARLVEAKNTGTTSEPAFEALYDVYFHNVYRGRYQKIIFFSEDFKVVTGTIDRSWQSEK